MRKATRYSTLGEMHRHLEDLIEQETSRPLPDQVELQRLKRQKLALKEEMVEWERLVQIRNRQKDTVPTAGRPRLRPSPYLAA